METNYRRRLVAMSVFLMGALLCAAALADPPGRVGRLSFLYGPVSLAPAGLDNEWSTAIVNRPITTGDHLWTDADAHAEVHVGSTALRIAPYTDVDVLNLDDRYTQLRLAQGTLSLRVRHLERDEQIEIDTPTAAVTVRIPGDYRIDVDSNGSSAAVSVRMGEAEVAGANVNLILYRDQGVTVYDDSPDYEISALAPADSFDRFCLDRDQREDNTRAARYVPSEMTGYEDLDAYGSWSVAQNYGAVWFPANVGPDWAPYRDGRWMWVEPWGWTWVDDQPWGFAPFHYGRWIDYRGRWCWYPGPRHGRPFYAPALVAFMGGAGLDRSPGTAAVGWFPLGYHEPYIPWYAVSPAYLREVNASHVRNVANISNLTRPNTVSGINYAHRGSATAVSGTTFVQGRPVRQGMLAPEAGRQLTRSPVLAGSAPMAPAQQSLIVKPTHMRPPDAALGRRVVALNAPPARPGRFALRQAEIAKEPNKPFRALPLPTMPPAAGTPAAGAGKGTALTVAPALVQVIRPPQARIGKTSIPASEGGERRVAPLPTPAQPARPNVPQAVIPGTPTVSQSHEAPQSMQRGGKPPVQPPPAAQAPQIEHPRAPREISIPAAPTMQAPQTSRGAQRAPSAPVLTAPPSVQQLNPVAPTTVPVPEPPMPVPQPQPHPGLRPVHPPPVPPQAVPQAPPNADEAARPARPLAPTPGAEIPRAWPQQHVPLPTPAPAPNPDTRLPPGTPPSTGNLPGNDKEMQQRQAQSADRAPRDGQEGNLRRNGSGIDSRR